MKNELQQVIQLTIEIRIIVTIALYLTSSHAKSKLQTNANLSRLITVPQRYISMPHKSIKKLKTGFLKW